MIHDAILRVAAMLAPANLRAEWMEEWIAELAMVRRHAPRRATGFCLGAFRDAFWLRRNMPSVESGIRFLDSPRRCLLLFAIVTAAGLGIAIRLPGPRLLLTGSGRLVSLTRVGRLTPAEVGWLEHHLPDEFEGGLVRGNGLVLARRKAGRMTASKISVVMDSGKQFQFDCEDFSGVRPLLALLWLAVMAMPVVIGENRLSMARPSRHWRDRLRFWGFFAAKVAMVLNLVFLGILDLSSVILAPLLPHVPILVLILGFRWAWRDQRRRCPVCLRRLTNPIPFGQAAHAFLDWYGTEFVCAEGHGMMHVPEIPTSSYPEPQWVSLDA
jgi:hypothetical protein